RELGRALHVLDLVADQWRARGAVEPLVDAIAVERGLERGRDAVLERAIQHDVRLHELRGALWQLRGVAAPPRKNHLRGCGIAPEQRPECAGDDPDSTHGPHEPSMEPFHDTLPPGKRLGQATPVTPSAQAGWPELRSRLRRGEAPESCVFAQQVVVASLAR